MYFIPFVIAPLVQIVLTFMALKSGLLVFTDSMIPWSTPPIISGYLYTENAVGALWQILLIFISTLICLPFVKRAEIQRQRENQQGFVQVIRLIEESHSQKQQVSHRSDRIGLFARQLVQDFNHDLQSPRVYLQYQPKVDLNGYIAGVEALIRWQHPHFGLVPATRLYPCVKKAIKFSNSAVRYSKWPVKPRHIGKPRALISAWR